MGVPTSVRGVFVLARPGVALPVTAGPPEAIVRVNRMDMLFRTVAYSPDGALIAASGSQLAR